MNRGAPAKINLALVVGPVRVDGKHEIVTILQRVDLRDEIVLEPSDDGDIVVDGYREDTLVRDALSALAEETGAGSGWRVRLDKRIPVAAGLGGGSSDAAAALALANDRLAKALGSEQLRALAGGVGADVPFFLAEGTQLGSGDGSELAPVTVPLEFAVVLVLPRGERKLSTADAYHRFDERGGSDGFAARRAALLEVLEGVRDPRDLAALPRNDLASSPLAVELESRGAFRADVSGAGPTVYALFDDVSEAERAASAVSGIGRTWVVRPVAT